MEGEVASFLISHNFAKIAKNTLVTSDKPRLTVRFIYHGILFSFTETILMINFDSFNIAKDIFSGNNLRYHWQRMQ